MFRIFTTFALALTLFLASECLVAQSEKSKSDETSDSTLKAAQEISAATGRPIFAVAGRST